MLDSEFEMWFIHSCHKFVTYSGTAEGDAPRIILTY